MSLLGVLKHGAMSDALMLHVTVVEKKLKAAQELSENFEVSMLFKFSFQNGLLVSVYSARM